MYRTLVRTGVPRKVLILISLLFPLLPAGCGERTQPPVIVSLTASPAHVFVGDEAVVQVEAYDPKGQELTVAWSTGEGSFTTISGTKAVWTSSVPGRHLVEVMVTDAYGESVKASVAIQVDDHIVLQSGTPVSLELLHDVRGDVVRIGELVPLRVVDPVYVQGFEVIAAGAYGIGQVLYVELPANGATGYVVLAPTRVQLVDGQIAMLNGKDAAHEQSRDDEQPGGNLQLAGTVLPLVAGESPKVPSGTLLHGIVREDVELEVRDQRIQPRGEMTPPPVTVSACLGIHAVDLSEYVVSVYSDGIRVEGFETGSAAGRSGLQIGDRIAGIRVGDETYPIAGMADLVRVERLLEPGDEVIVQVRNLLRRADIPLVVGTCYTLP